MGQDVQLGLKQNWRQFTILVIVNAFVGGMVGLERTIFPSFAEESFAVKSTSAVLSFIIAFGITKAFTNYFMGKLANLLGRKRLLVIGWLFALPVPFILIYAPHWNWVVFANVLLGINQGLAWSSTVVMKIDLVGEKDRGLAMGLNEFAGYFSVGVVAFATAAIANAYGLTPYPFYLGIAISLGGLLLSIFFVKDTRHHVNVEQKKGSSDALMKNVFLETTFTNKNLSAITQAGFINNMNDGMVWGLLPIFLLSLHYNTEQSGVITALYPAVWGIGQLFTGRMADLYSKKKLLFWGMLFQGLAILWIPFENQFVTFIVLASVLGAGTALVYPTFMAAVAQEAPTEQRAESIGVFRLWRDLGYAFGAVCSGIIADLFGIESAILSIGVLTLISSFIIKLRMQNAL